MFDTSLDPSLALRPDQCHKLYATCDVPQDTGAIDAMRVAQVRDVHITRHRQIKHGGAKGCPACFGQAKVLSTECRARFEVLLAQDDPAAAKVEEPAGGAAQARPWSNALAGVLDAGSTAPDVPRDAGSPAPLAHHDEDSVIEKTCSSSAVIEHMQGLVVAAEHEDNEPARWRMSWVSLRSRE